MGALNGKRVTTTALLTWGLLTLAACDRKAQAPVAAVPPASPGAAVQSPGSVTETLAAPPLAKPVAAGAEVPSAATVDQAPPVRLCEVELGGKLTGVDIPKGSEAIVYVTAGDCLTPDAHVLTRAIGTAEATFFAEVFVPCGIDLMVCGSVEPASLDTAPQSTTLYGKLDRKLHAEGEGEIEFRDLAVPMVRGPARTFPAPRR
jgi:hypothetical protein